MKYEQFNRRLEKVLEFIYQVEDRAKKELEIGQSKYIHKNPNLNSHPKLYDSNLAIREEKSLYSSSNI